MKNIKTIYQTLLKNFKTKFSNAFKTEGKEKLNKEIKIHEIENYRKFNISYLSPTNYRGARVKISEPKRYHTDKTQNVVLSYCYETGDIGQQALNYLIDKGFKPIARCSEHKFYTILCDNWAEDFIKLNK